MEGRSSGTGASTGAAGAGGQPPSLDATFAGLEDWLRGVPGAAKPTTLRWPSNEDLQRAHMSSSTGAPAGESGVYEGYLSKLGTQTFPALTPAQAAEAAAAAAQRLAARTPAAAAACTAEAAAAQPRRGQKANK